MAQSVKPPAAPRVRKLMPSLGVADLPRAVAFYRDFFGFEIVDSYDDDAGRPLWCWLRAGVAELQLQQLDEERQITLDPAIGQSWVLYLRPDDLDGVHARLRAAGVDVSDIELTAYGARECFCKDADGYDLWLTEPESGRGPDDEDDDDPAPDGDALAPDDATLH
ncbi:MAG: VOC family protein [Burkholderiales bacterium]|jgi:catechol 2,3-dioxygenase-like lactoylglutathione lyase family enzyme|nr:VOC family protein [Burkholderiales bacterium]